MTLTRRSLLRRGGATAAGATILGAAVAPKSVRAQPSDDRAPNAVLVVLPLVRATHVNAFDGDSPAITPNLDAVTRDSLRFDRAIPESMPALPARRALITGMRAFPFRDWRRTEGMPAVPGFNPIYDHQPVMTEVMRAGGVTTVYVSDNPILQGPRFPDVRRTAAGRAGPPPGGRRTGRSNDRGDRQRSAARPGPGDRGRRGHLPRGHRRATAAQGDGAVLPRRRPVRPARRRRGAERVRQAGRG